MGIIAHDLGMDLGTSNTLVYVKHKGIVVSEPTIAVVEATNERHVRAIGNDAPLPTWERTGVLIDAYAMLAVAFAAVALLVILLRSTLSEKVFSDCALRTLNGLSVCCFLEGILFAYVAIYFPAVLCLTLAAFFLGVCLRVVKNVIAEAMRYKEENELTV